jgi:hypothetical protein
VLNSSLQKCNGCQKLKPVGDFANERRLRLYSFQNLHWLQGMWLKLPTGFSVLAANFSQNCGKQQRTNNRAGGGGGPSTDPIWSLFSPWLSSVPDCRLLTFTPRMLHSICGGSSSETHPSAPRKTALSGAFLAVALYPADVSRQFAQLLPVICRCLWCMKDLRQPQCNRPPFGNVVDATDGCHGRLSLGRRDA